MKELLAVHYYTERSGSPLLTRNCTGPERQSNGSSLPSETRRYTLIQCDESYKNDLQVPGVESNTPDDQLYYSMSPQYSGGQSFEIQNTSGVAYIKSFSMGGTSCQKLASRYSTNGVPPRSISLHRGRLMWSNDM